MEKRLLEECLAKGMSLEAIGRGAGRHPSTVSYWLKKHGLRASGARCGSRPGPIDKEKLEALLDAGATLAEMAEEFGRSVSSVRYWIDRWQIVQPNRRGPRAREAGGARTARFECHRHGLTEFRLEGRGTYRCMRCRSAAVSKRRRVVKRRLVEEAGGACALCGYDRWPGAMHFHHLDPAEKKFHIGHQGHSRSLARTRAEAGKCLLVCANCHAEIEGGFATLPFGREAAPGSE